MMKVMMAVVAADDTRNEDVVVVILRIGETFALGHCVFGRLSLLHFKVMIQK
jgi:hypothetical protein